MKDECLICGEPLKYSANEKQMECAVCHKKRICHQEQPLALQLLDLTQHLCPGKDLRFAEKLFHRTTAFYDHYFLFP